MMKKMLATTALVALMATPAMAASPAGGSDDSVYMMTIKTVGSADTKGYLASNLMGRTVYASKAEDADAVGDVNDVVIGNDGSVKAVILGVGGFIGMGEKDVAISFDRLSMVKTGDDEYRLTTSATKADLEGAQAYERDERLSMRDGKVAEDRNVAETERTKPTSREAFLAGKTKMTGEKLSAEVIIGADAYDAEWNSIGEIGDVLVTADGKLDAMVVDVGGFLGIGEKPVAISVDQVEFYQGNSDEVFVLVPYTSAELENAKSYDAEVYKTDQDTVLLTPKS